MTSTLALLRALAGCRAVLHDARIEADALYHEVAAGNDADTMIAFQRAARRVADVEGVVVEAEAALWDGGEAERVDCRTFRRMAPQRPDVSAAAFDDYRYDYRDPDDPDMSYEDAHRAWADERIRERRDRVRVYLATDWLAWDDRWRRARTRQGFFGVDRSANTGPALGSDAMRERLVEAVAAIDAVGSEPDVVYMNPETYAQLQAQERRATTATRASALARVYGTGAFEVPRGARLSFDTVAMPPTRSAPDAFDPPAARRSGAADALAYAYGYMRDRAAPGPQRTSYRPRWAPVLAATLANLLTDGPASGVPGMGDS